MGIVEPIDLSNEIAKWKSAVYGKDVRAANTSAFEKIQTSVNGTVENVNQAAENAQNASKNAQDAVDRVQGAIDTATKKAEEAAASQLEAQKSETAAGEYKTAAGTSAVNAAKSAERAEAVKEQLGGFDGTAKTVKATDTYGIIASAMGESNAQALIDAVTNQVMNELLKKSQVVNNLLATIAGNALDAVQGKALSDKIVSLEEAYAQLNSDLGAQYWGGVAQNIAINAGAWTTVPKKITLPPGTYILLGHATIPGNLNKLGKIRFSIENLYETSQSWYPSNDIVEINVVSFKTFTKTEEVSLEITAESSFIATSAEVAAMRIK